MIKIESVCLTTPLLVVVPPYVSSQTSHPPLSDSLQVALPHPGSDHRSPGLRNPPVDVWQPPETEHGTVS